MKKSIHIKLENLLYRHQELSKLLSEPAIIANNDNFRKLSKEYADLDPIVVKFQEYLALDNKIKDAQAMLADQDSELRSLAAEEIVNLQQNKNELSNDLQLLLIPKDDNDACNVFLEIRAGTGGDEAALFAGNLFRMYSRFIENKKWQLAIMNSNESEQGGYKEIIVKITGKNVFSKLKFESGTHRVQRVPATESQGRIHTSACTVAVLPEVITIESIDIKPSDLRIDTFRASGAGGQHINKTDSAIRITHLPTNTVVECQEERSQHKNRAKALSLLQAKILVAALDEQQRNEAEKRKSLVGSGDRSERIRTYNFPQGRITEHRINLTLYQLEDILDGNLEPIIEPLIQENQANLLASLE